RDWEHGGGDIGGGGVGGADRRGRGRPWRPADRRRPASSRPVHPLLPAAGGGQVLSGRAACWAAAAPAVSSCAALARAVASWRSPAAVATSAACRSTTT